MEALHRKDSGDPEAAIFYGLALMGTAPATDKEDRNQKKAAVIRRWRSWRGRRRGLQGAAKAAEMIQRSSRYNRLIRLAT
jgi:hypothetical protein